MLGREFGGECFDRALRVHDFRRGDAGEVELHGERLGEQARIAARNARPAALAHLDVGDAERLQGAQRVARHDPADAEARRQVLLGAEEVAGLELLGKQRVAHLSDDVRGKRGRLAADEDRRGGFAACGLNRRMDGHREWSGVSR